jgi:hypothetical protein
LLTLRRSILKEFKKTYCVCSGESKDKTVPWEEKKKLNNEKLTRYMAKSFISYLMHTKKIKTPIKVIFSNEVIYVYGTRRKQWGGSYKWCRTIILYRHSVWVFLHEIAHILAPEGELHGIRFAKKLPILHRWWKEFKGSKGLWMS